MKTGGREEAAAKRAPRGSAERLVGDVWATGMDSAAIHQQGRAPAIDWNRYFQQIGATRIGSVEVCHPGFFRALDSLLRAAPLETWKGYLRFWLIKVNAPFLDDGTYGEFFTYQSAVTGQ